MGLYVSKPVQIEAIQFRGNNVAEIREFGGEAIGSFDTSALTLMVMTNHGNVLAETSDWIIKTSKGECYPCKPDVFAEKYERSIFDDVDEGGEETDETKAFAADGPTCAVGLADMGHRKEPVVTSGYAAVEFDDDDIPF